MQPRDKFFTALFDIRSSAATCAADNVEIVRASGQLNADGMESLRSALTTCARRGTWRYVVDLSRVKRMDAPGLGMLVSALRTIHDLGGTVGLVTGSPRFQRILELCARSRSCKIYNSTSDAVGALQALTRPTFAA